KLEQCVKLLNHWKALVDDKRFITRRPEHLNNLWRTMTLSRALKRKGYHEAPPSKKDEMVLKEYKKILKKGKGTK
ncbi:MAG: hypothetical protein P8Y39_03150, partial [Nitrospirota bacterium]